MHGCVCALRSQGGGDCVTVCNKKSNTLQIQSFIYFTCLYMYSRYFVVPVCIHMYTGQVYVYD